MTEEKQADKKHRPDVGDPDHGPVDTVAVTKVIQVILGASVVLSAALLLYTAAIAIL